MGQYLAKQLERDVSFEHHFLVDRGRNPKHPYWTKKILTANKDEPQLTRHQITMRYLEEMKFLGKIPDSLELAKKISHKNKPSKKTVDAAAGYMSYEIGSIRSLDSVQKDGSKFSEDVSAKKLENLIFLKEALASLKLKEKELITQRFGLGGLPPKTLEELAREMGVCRRTIQNKEAEILLKLRRKAAC